MSVVLRAMLPPASQPLLQDRDVGDAMVFGQVVRGRQAMPATTDDDDVVGRFRRRVAPKELGMIGQMSAGGWVIGWSP